MAQNTTETKKKMRKDVYEENRNMLTYILVANFTEMKTYISFF